MAGTRILILEDDEMVGPMFATALSGGQNEVVVCTSYEEARKELKRELPGALLTDIRLEGYNGLQLAILFRSLSPNAPIMVVSGHDDEVIKEEARRIGAAFLLKPVDIDKLRAYFAT
jgi:DNA-binding response OmpR family regulator